MTTTTRAILLATWVLATPLRAAEVLLLDDPLAGATTGTQQGGSFTGDGWQAAAGDVRIAYDLGQAYGQGRLEIDVVNFLPCSQPNAEKCHVLSLWQSENQYRDSASAAQESYWILRTGTGYFPPASTDCHYKILTRSQGPEDLVQGYEARVDRNFTDSAAATYHLEFAWDASGHVVFRRDGTVLYEHDHGAPVRLRHLLVGRDRESKPNYGEQPGVIYKNVKIYVDDQSGGGGDAGSAGPDAAPGPDAAAATDSSVADSGAASLRTFLAPTDDTYAAPLSPDTAHGAEATVQVGGDGSGGHGRTAYLRFDLAGIQGSILQARLHLRATNGGGGGALVSVPDSAWSEASLTWNNRPYIGAALYGQLGQVVVDEPYSVDLTYSVYAGWQHSFALISTEDDGAAFGSKENPDHATRPVLEVVYVPGAGPDAGTTMDSAIAHDAGSAPDRASGTDTGAGGDGSVADTAQLDRAASDAPRADGTVADQLLPDGGPATDPGCGCTVADTPARGPALILVFATALGRRRRRRP